MRLMCWGVAGPTQMDFLIVFNYNHATTHHAGNNTCLPFVITHKLHILLLSSWPICHTVINKEN